MKPDKQHPATMEGLVKVTFDLPNKDGRIASESLWAEPVGDNSYRLRNVPFFIYGYSEQDIIRAEASESKLTVRGIVERGGHSTYRIFLAEQTTEEQFNKDWVPLGELGCSYERASQHNGERDRLWEFEEGHCGHPLRQTFR